jgi:hypothetical protein
VSGEFDVQPAELRAAADRIRSAVSPVTCWTMPGAGASAAAFGHHELAEVYHTFCTKLSQVVSGAAAGSEHLAAQLDATAATYEATDSCVSTTYSSGLGPALTLHPFPGPASSSGRP